MNPVEKVLRGRTITKIRIPPKTIKAKGEKSHLPTLEQIANVVVGNLAETPERTFIGKGFTGKGKPTAPSSIQKFLNKLKLILS
jgi:hypothetical protein